MNRLKSKHVGALLGLGLGLLIVHYGLFKAVFVAAVIAVGWYLGRVADGEIAFPQGPGSRDVDDLE